MTDKIIDEVMHMVAELENAVYDVATTGRGASDALRLNHAIRAKLREVLERKPLSDHHVNLLAHNLDEGDWSSLLNRDCWLKGFHQGFKESEKHHQIGAK